ncbi:TolC family protein [Hydrogenimonas thermophila]|uniref:Outer membrane protein TolC n=1 Tax=Hydrogenimonas thermophila TaxID=223786 RepID=A0A1I5U667_9BACT|nr:TolC family protein [Hydrogenimonas thermophila]SFP90407.1 Outer membrane protein TolC [Hydrogenimonas thermophila]
MALNGLSLRSLACSLFAATSLYAGEADELLSSLKLETLQLKLNKNSSESGKLEYSWINSINVSYGYSSSNQFGRTLTNKSLSVSVDQPIFKSGGIWYAVKYAKATKRVGDLSVEAERRALIKQVVSTLFNLKKSEYQIQKQKLLIENDRIDIERKKEQFLSGDLDSGFLDQAILKKNQDMMTLYSLQDTKAQLESNFKNLSDLNPNSVTLPKFTLMQRDDFIKNNVDLALAKEQIVQKDYFNTMTWTRYMVTLSLQASYVKPYEYSSAFPTSLPNALDPYYTYGFRISLPIDITSYHNIQSTKADYLKAKIELSDKKREAENEYSAVLKRLDVIDKKLKLAIDDEKLYSSLVESTKEKVKAGEMTLYDLKTMENSKMIRKIDQKIFDLDKQLVLLDLYEKSYEEIQ